VIVDPLTLPLEAMSRLVVSLMWALRYTLAEESCDQAALLQRHEGRFYHEVTADVWNKSSWLPRASVLPTPKQVEHAMKIHQSVRDHAVKKDKSGTKETHETKCQVDLRSSLPACMQYTPDWCWATVTAQLAGYFDPTHNPESGDYEKLGTSGLHENAQRSESCLGEECRIVGSQFAPSIMDACCSEDVEPFRSSYLCDTGADVGTIEKAIDWATSQSYVAKEGPLKEEDLIAVLNKGHPVPYAVLWVDPDTGMYRGGHIMILGGCNGQGKYFLHDSLSNLTRTDTWQELTHAELLDYNPWAMVDNWPAVEKIDGVPVQQASNEALRKWGREKGVLGRWFYSFVLSKDLYQLNMQY